jgi:hypothetical protein
LGRKHHSKGHFAKNDGACGEERDEDVAEIRCQENTDALPLAQSKVLCFVSVGADGDPLPFPALAALKPVDLDFGHGMDHLKKCIALARFDRESFEVQVAPPL